MKDAGCQLGATHWVQEPLPPGAGALPSWDVDALGLCGGLLLGSSSCDPGAPPQPLSLPEGMGVGLRVPSF